MTAWIGSCPKGVEQLSPGGVAQIDDVLGVVAEHVDDIAAEGVGVPVGEGHLGHVPVRVVAVADDYRDTVRVAHLLRQRSCNRSREGGPQHPQSQEEGEAMQQDADSHPSHPFGPRRLIDYSRDGRPVSMH